MPRLARVVVPNIPHHITQRGNNRQDVFLDANDRGAYLRSLRVQSKRYDLTIVAYCLMTNHVHLVAIPRQENSLAKALGRAHFTYTQRFNHRHGRTGHLWQNRFYSCPLDEKRTLSAVLYVEQNPARAGLVTQPWEYEWSSAAAHVGEPDRTSLLDSAWWRQRSDAGQWRAMLAAVQPPREASDLRMHTARGRPLGSEQFVRRLEALLGRRLRALPVGRPKKKHTHPFPGGDTKPDASVHRK